MKIDELNDNQSTNFKLGAQSQLLPEDFKVYVFGNTVVNVPYWGFEERTLPTYNHYKGEDGGYVAIYTREKEGSIYSVGNGIYVLGQVRVKGEYFGRIFVPEGYRLGDDITQDPNILPICRECLHLPEGKEFWIGGDTGGWFGIQK